MLGVEDFSFLDADELGVRPDGWNEELGNTMDFDETTAVEFFQQKKFDHCPMNNPSDDEDESGYDIDPETGEKIFREAVITVCQSLSTSSPSNYHWVEEYLSNLPTVPVNIPKRSTIEYPSVQSDFDWQRTESNYNIYSMEDKTSSQTYYLPMTNDNLFSVSTDDEHSTTSSGSQGRRYFHSIKDFDGQYLMTNESNISDGDLNYDGNFLRTKLEKMERDEHSLTPLFVRRSSTRPHNQGQQDAELLLQSNIPLTVADITQSSTEEYNRHLAQLNHLTAEQMHIIKDIRRRGKNKIAAQNCRKRKANSVEVLLEEVDELKRMKNDLEERKRIYQQQIDETRHQYEYLHRQVLPNRQLPPAIFVK